MRFNILFVLLLSASFAMATTDPKGYEISVTVKGLPKGTNMMLANYYGGGQYKQDSALTDETGKAVFKGDVKWPQGVYIFYPVGRPYFDFIMDEGQHFSLQTDTLDYIRFMKVKGSDENQFFSDYQKFISEKGKKMSVLQNEYKRVKANADSAKIIEKEIKVIDEEVKAYKKDFETKHPDSFVCKLLKMIDDPVVPEAPVDANGKKDTTFAFRYYKAHFFDNIDFSDGRVLYTPVFHNKIKQYLDKLTVQNPEQPDSLYASVDYITAKAKANPEVFKYLVNWMTYNYESSKIMGMEAVFVHLVEQNHLQGKTPWIDSTQLFKITNKALFERNILLGKPAPEIVMQDTLGKTISLSSVKAKYTIVVFWDYGCGHCKKEIPELKKLYDEKLKAKGVAIYAIESEQPNKDWRKFIKEHDLNWINIGQEDDYKRAVTKKYYDVISTPTIFVLDENKIIRGKRIGVEQLEDYFGYLEKKKK